MGYVHVVGKQQLKRVLPRGHVELGPGSGITEMDVIGIRRYRQAQVWQFVINDDVVMAAVRGIIAGRRKRHPVEPELQLDRAGNSGAIRRRYEKYSRIPGRRRPGHGRGCRGFGSGFFRCRARISTLLAARRKQKQ
jgi:hypothetical protein